ncbi:hypothetical protein OIU34_18430 [Pararhizobium sp. BT-229]|uniref:hypothetical protein n=1 Tax=Pararhizobium sp. BT-229 TaxID=2986923 RepID=UPI0021F721D7|nr:hypothetical protein [Pararhizobium sp. BT-229]MCV9963857.1 hypothetical protein [Pararhizobium sp. BT-229]
MLFFKNIEGFAERRSSSPEVRRIVAQAINSLVPQRDQEYFFPDEMTKIRDISDWIVCASRSGSDWYADRMDDGLPRVFAARLGLEGVWRIAHSALEANGGSLLPPYREGDEEEVHTFADGYRAVRLATWEAVARDSGKLKASPSTEGVFVDGDLETGKLGLISVRDASNEPVLMLSVNRLAVCDVVAWNRKPPTRQMVKDHVMPLVEARGLAPMKVDSIPGTVLAADGMIYDLCELPDGVVINGDLHIMNKCPDLERLPDDMTVNGTLIIWQNNRLTEVPRNLRATEGLGITGCPNITVVRQGVSCPEFSSFAGCRNLKAFEGGCDFPKGVELPDNKELRSLFPMFERRGDDISAVVRPSTIPLPAAVKGLAGRIARTVAVAKDIASPGIVSRTRKGGSLLEALSDIADERDARLLSVQAEMDDELERRNAATAAVATPSTNKQGI